MLSSEVAQSLKSYGHFSDLEVTIALSHRHVEFFGYSKYNNPGLAPTHNIYFNLSLKHVFSVFSANKQGWKTSVIISMLVHRRRLTLKQHWLLIKLFNPLTAVPVYIRFSFFIDTLIDSVLTSSNKTLHQTGKISKSLTSNLSNQNVFH